jgi:hypothetical protein
MIENLGFKIVWSVLSDVGCSDVVSCNIVCR